MNSFMKFFHVSLAFFILGIIFGLNLKISPKFRALIIPQGIRGEEAIFVLKINPKGFDLSGADDVVSAPASISVASTVEAAEKKKKNKK